MIVDVSSHNGANDWKKAKASGVEAAIIRCGYGRDFTKYDDRFFKQNIEGALANNIVVGVYLYSYAKDVTAAIEEAKHAIRLCDPYKSRIALPIFYDLEERDRAKGASERAVAWCDYMKKAGYMVGVYADTDYIKNYLKEFEKYDAYRWVAKWSEPKPTGRVDLWQYDAHGKVAGIGSGVDLDRAYGTLADIIAGKTPTPTPTPTPKGVTEVEVKVLMRGMRGEAEVFAVQSILRAQNYKYDKKLIGADGNFGKITEACVISFQNKNGLKADGIVGAKTWDKLING